MRELDETIQDLIEISTTAIILNPEESSNYFIRAQQYLKIGKFNETIEDMNKAIEINKKVEYCFLRGLAYEKINEIANAHLDFEEVKKDKDLIEAIKELDEDSHLKPKTYFFRIKKNQTNLFIF